MTGAVKMFKLDLITMKVYFKSYLIFLAYPIIFAWWGPSGMALMGGMMLSVLSGSIFSVQEKNKLERLYGVLSISDAHLVAGRYCFTMANCLLVQVFMLPLQVLAGRVMGYQHQAGEFCVAVGLSYLLFWLMASFQIPIYFKFGYTKTRMWVMLPILCIAFIPALVGGLQRENTEGIGAAMEGMLTTMFNNDVQIMVICLIAGTLLALISYMISIAVYKSTKK